MYRILPLLFAIGATAPGWAIAEQREVWIPGPGSLYFGAIAEDRLLAYEWGKSDSPSPLAFKMPPVWFSVKHARVPSEQWLREPEWRPKDVRWFVADLGNQRVRPLLEAVPHEAKALSSLRGELAPHHAPHRWRLAQGRFWATTIVANPSGLVYLPFWARLQEMPMNLQQPASSHASSFSSPHSWIEASRLPFLEEVGRHGLNWWDGWKPQKEKLSYRVDFDFVPGDSRLTFFVLAENGMGVWEVAWDGSSIPKDSRWVRRGAFAAPFLEPFHVAASKDEYFFVTDESGEVYAAENRDGQWTTRTVWKDAARPVVAMLVESDGATAFAFGKDFYMKLGRDDKPKPCRDVTQGPAEFGQPLRTVYECGRVLFDSGELKDAKPKD